MSQWRLCDQCKLIFGKNESFVRIGKQDSHIKNACMLKLMHKQEIMRKFGADLFE